jgi:hypothetical protein
VCAYCQITEPDKPSNANDKKQSIEKFTDSIYTSIDTVPARLEMYGIDGDRFYYLRPIDLDQFVYLSHFPLTAYLFVTEQTLEKIQAMTVHELKSGYFGGYDANKYIPGGAFIRSLKYIKGYEEYAQNIKSLNEIELIEQKDIYINKLIECWSKYKDEYESKYMRLYSLLLAGKFSKAPVTATEYGGESKKWVIAYDMYEYAKKYYNFDSQTLRATFEYFSFTSLGWDIAKHNRDLINIERHPQVYIPLEIMKQADITNKNVLTVYQAILAPSKENVTNFGNGGTTYVNAFSYSTINLVICKSVRENNLFAFPYQPLYQTSLYETGLNEGEYEVDQY